MKAFLIFLVGLLLLALIAHLVAPDKHADWPQALPWLKR